MTVLSDALPRAHVSRALTNRSGSTTTTRTGKSLDDDEKAEPTKPRPYPPRSTTTARTAPGVGVGVGVVRSSSPLLPTSSSSSSLFSTTSSSSAASSSSSSDGPQTNKSKKQVSSLKCQEAVNLLPIYLTDARAVVRYCPRTCPDGALQLSVAENLMLEDLVVPAVNEFASSGSVGTVGGGTAGGAGGVGGEAEAGGGLGSFVADMIYYQPTHGRLGVRRSMASYLHRLLNLPPNSSLDVEGMVIGAGCNAVLENLCLCLAEPGDAVLIPTPYYAAFEFDLVARAGLRIVPVETMGHHPEIVGGLVTSGGTAITLPVPVEAYYPNGSSLDAALETARASGSEPRILLLSHPNNPLGVCYPPHVVKECIEWGRRHEIHVVSDEIYAGSVYGDSTSSSSSAEDEDEDEGTFVSALALAAGHVDADATPTDNEGLGLGPYVHLVYALSKDFALSGLRVGAAYSENLDIRLPMQKLNDLCQVSSQTQVLVERMLSAPAGEGGGGYWSTDDFLPEARARIRSRSERLKRCLSDADVPYLPADSGMFVWMDLREFLPPMEDDDGGIARESPESMDRRERALYLELLWEHGLLFTPGRSMRNELPGFFRCVFTAASEAEFELGLERIARFVGVKRGMAS